MILFGIYNSLLFNGFYQKSFRFYIFFEASVAEISEIYFLLNIVNYQLELVFFLPCTYFCNNQTFGNEPPFLEVSNYKLFLEKKIPARKVPATGYVLQKIRFPFTVLTKCFIQNSSFH